MRSSCEVCGHTVATTEHGFCVRLEDMRWRAKAGILDHEEREELERLEQQLKRVPGSNR